MTALGVRLLTAAAPISRRSRFSRSRWPDYAGSTTQQAAERQCCGACPDLGGRVLTCGGGMGLAGSGSSRDSARWRVFLSHTSELQEFPRFKSYLDVVKEAISAAGHVIVEMAGFPAADRPAAEMCAELVRGCEVYVGVLGTRYGSPVGDRPELSYTEL